MKAMGLMFALVTLCIAWWVDPQEGKSLSDQLSIESVRDLLDVEGRAQKLSVTFKGTPEGEQNIHVIYPDSTGYLQKILPQETSLTLTVPKGTQFWASMHLNFRIKNI